MTDFIRVCIWCGDKRPETLAELEEYNHACCAPKGAGHLYERITICTCGRQVKKHQSNCFDCGKEYNCGIPRNGGAK